MNETRKIEQFTRIESSSKETLPPSSVEEIEGEVSFNESVTPVVSVSEDAISQTQSPVSEEQVSSISSGYPLTSNTAEGKGQSSVARNALSQKLRNELPAN